MSGIYFYILQVGNNSCTANPSSTSIYCCHRINHSIALEMGWSDPFHGFGVVLSCLELGTIPLENLIGNFQPFSFARCSFSVQLDIESTAGKR